MPYCPGNFPRKTLELLCIPKYQPAASQRIMPAVVGPFRFHKSCMCWAHGRNLTKCKPFRVPWRESDTGAFVFHGICQRGNPSLTEVATETESNPKVHHSYKAKTRRGCQCSLFTWTQTSESMASYQNQVSVTGSVLNLAVYVPKDTSNDDQWFSLSTQH